MADILHTNTDRRYNTVVWPQRVSNDRDKRAVFDPPGIASTSRIFLLKEHIHTE